MKKKRIVWKVFGILMMVALFAFILGFGTMMLWNWLVPELFAGPVITFWQALGLLLLCKLLLGFPGKHKEGGWAEKKKKWRQHWESRMSDMTPEEKERMKDHFSRCVGGRWGWKSPREEELTDDKKEGDQPKI